MGNVQVGEYVTWLKNGQRKYGEVRFISIDGVTAYVAVMSGRKKDTAAVPLAKLTVVDT